jgi:hypothetical protein
MIYYVVRGVPTSAAAGLGVGHGCLEHRNSLGGAAALPTVIPVRNSHPRRDHQSRRRTLHELTPSIGRLIVGRLLNRELCSRICFKAFVWDGRTAADRATVAAVFDPLEGTINRNESVAQARGYGVVDALLYQWRRWISRIAFGLVIIGACCAEIGQQLLYLRTLRIQ